MFNIVEIIGGFIKLVGGTDKTTIGNASDALKVNLRNASGTETGTSSNPLYVTPTAPAPSPTGVTTDYNEVLSVASGVETSLISIVAGGSGKRIYKISVSGENIALYRVKVDGNDIYQRRTSFTEFNTDFIFDNLSSGLILTSGQTLQVTVYHTRPVSANFEVTVLGE